MIALESNAFVISETCEVCYPLIKGGECNA